MRKSSACNVSQTIIHLLMHLSPQNRSLKKKDLRQYQTQKVDQGYGQQNNLQMVIKMGTTAHVTKGTKWLTMETLD